MTYKIGAVFLAAGLSRRAGRVNKLLATLDGSLIIQQSLATLVACGCHPINVVTGNQSNEIEDALGSEPVSFMFNPDYAEGMATSVCAGIQALPAFVDAAFVVLADMPHVRIETYRALISAYSPEQGHEICVPVYENAYGNPVLFGRRFFAELTKLEGDKGGKSVLKKNLKFVTPVTVADSGVRIDYDTVQGLE